MEVVSHSDASILEMELFNYLYISIKMKPVYIWMRMRITGEEGIQFKSNVSYLTNYFGSLIFVTLARKKHLVPRVSGIDMWPTIFFTRRNIAPNLSWIDNQGDYSR